MPDGLPYNTKQMTRSDQRTSCPHFMSTDKARLVFEVEGREYSCEFKPVYKNTTPSGEYLVPQTNKDKNLQPDKQPLRTQDTTANDN